MRISGGPARGRKLAKPVHPDTRPPLARLRESVFSILGDRVAGSRVLDTFAGTGAFGLEALGRGARAAVFVESQRAVARQLEAELRELALHSRATVCRGDALAALSPSTFLATRAHRPGRAVDELLRNGIDLVFVDPPFALFEESGERERLLGALAATLGDPLLAADAEVILRAPTGATGLTSLRPIDDRVYGRSRMLFLRKEGAST